MLAPRCKFQRVERETPNQSLHDTESGFCVQIFDHHAYFLEFCRDATSFVMKKEDEDWGFKLGIPDDKKEAFIQVNGGNIL